MDFSSEQRSYMDKGASVRRHMIDTIKDVVQQALFSGATKEWDKDYKDAVISGTMGIGKTYNAIKELKEIGIHPVVIKGNQSIANLAGALMTYHYRFVHSEDYYPGKKMVIIFDDCDALFENSSSINILKGMTGKVGERMFQHNVQINPHQYSDFQQSILQHYAPQSGAAGIHINCDDIVFIFTTNFVIPTENEAKNYMAKKGATPQARKKMDLAAVRRRMAPTSTFNIPSKTNWGWVAHVALNDGGLDILDNEQDKIILLDWMWYNWDRMTETNLSTIEKMAVIMKKYPTEYKDKWEAAFIDQMMLV